MSTTEKLKLNVEFDAEHTTHPSAREWSKTHSLIGLRHADADGNPIQGPAGERLWFVNDGDDAEVHIIRVVYPQDPDEQILRILSDSKDDAIRLAVAEMRRTFYGNWAAIFTRSNDRAMAEQVNRERNLMREFIVSQHGEECAANVIAGKENPCPKKISPKRIRNAKKQ